MTGSPVSGTSNGGAAQAAPRRSSRANAARAKRAIAFGLLTSLSSGCYSYTTIEPAEVAPGQGVRARLTTEQSARLEDLMGIRNRVIAGEVVDAGASAITLSIPTALPQPGLNGGVLHQRVEVPVEGIIELEERRLSRWRTYSLIGGAAAIVGYALAETFSSGDSRPGDDKEDPDNIVVPIRIRFP